MIFVYGAALSAQNRVEVLDGLMSFERPGNVLPRSELPAMGQTEEMVFLDQKVLLGVVVEDEAALRQSEYNELSIELKELLERKSNLTNNDLLGLLKGSTSLKFSQGSIATVEEIYSLFYYNNKVIGEKCGYAEIQGSYASDIYGLYFVVAIDSHLVTVSLRLTDRSLLVPQSLPEYFEYKDEYKEFWWRNPLESRKKLFQRLLSSDYKTLPENLQNLRESWDTVINSLTVELDESYPDVFEVSDTIDETEKLNNTNSVMLETVEADIADSEPQTTSVFPFFLLLISLLVVALVVITVFVLVTEKRKS
jgi:hypothetical protein